MPYIPLTHKDKLLCSPEVLESIKEYCDECGGDCYPYYCQWSVRKATSLQKEVDEVEKIFEGCAA